TSYSWTFNGSPIVGATGNTVTANIDQLGSYKATVTDVNGCVSTSNAITISGMESDHLWIYPNPSSDGRFQVRLYNSGVPNERRVISIYNSAGALVMEKVFNLDNSMSP